MRSFNPRNTMETKLKHLLATIIVAAALCTLLSAQITPQTTSSSQTPARKSVRQYLRGQLVAYHGMVSGVDKNAKTFTIEGRRESRVLKIIDGTAITKAGQTATIEDINSNDEVSGSYLKNADGTLVARSVKIGSVKRRATPTPTATPVR
jgi:hypothetical protein